jgi:DNA primase
MVNQLLVSLINSVLGTGKATARGNYAYHCPKCTNSTKNKLEVCLDETSPDFQKFGCWVCKFKGKKLLNLFRTVEANHDKILELKSLIKDASPTEKTKLQETKVSLPEEYKSILNNKSLTAKQALSYIKNRGITEDDILKYNIGYCETGLYANMVIIPSYDESGMLNYFVGRSFISDSNRKLNPSVSRDIIPFEIFINWNSPLILCEGMFDAITIKRNVIPLLGKNLQSKLMQRIVTSTVKKIYIALDKDAIKQALDFCEQLINEGKTVYLVELTDKDPNEIGFKNFTNLIQNTFPLTYSGLLEKKLSL